MLDDLFIEAWEELNSAASDREHPFRLCSLATCEEPGKTRQRTVALREVTESKSLLFYTDIRSWKIKQLENIPQGSVLFYNQKIALQVFIQGNFKIHTNSKIWKQHVGKVEGKSIYDYNTKYPPGKVIKNPFNINRTDDINFAVLELTPNVIEYLKLKPDTNHLRAMFSKEEDNWEKHFLVP